MVSFREWCEQCTNLYTWQMLRRCYPPGLAEGSLSIVCMYQSTLLYVLQMCLPAVIASAARIFIGCERGSSRIWCSYPGSFNRHCFSLSTLCTPRQHVIQRSRVQWRKRISHCDFAALGKPKRDPDIVFASFASPSCYIAYFYSPSEFIDHLAILLSQIEPASLSE